MTPSYGQRKECIGKYWILVRSKTDGNGVLYLYTGGKEPVKGGTDGVRMGGSAGVG